MHPGETDFSVADRLAIINLINSYAKPYDEDKLDEWFSLFVKDMKVTVVMGTADPAVFAGEPLKEFFRGFRGALRNDGIIPRHFLSNVTIENQSATTAQVAAYATYVPLDNATVTTPLSKDKTRITGTALYTFQVVKEADGVWRFKEYAIKFDQSEV